MFHHGVKGFFLALRALPFSQSCVTRNALDCTWPTLSVSIVQVLQVGCESLLHTPVSAVQEWHPHLNYEDPALGRRRRRGGGTCGVQTPKAEAHG